MIDSRVVVVWGWNGRKDLKGLKAFGSMEYVQHLDHGDGFMRYTCVKTLKLYSVLYVNYSYRELLKSVQYSSYARYSAGCWGNETLHGVCPQGCEFWVAFIFFNWKLKF